MKTVYVVEMAYEYNPEGHTLLCVCASMDRADDFIEKYVRTHTSEGWRRISVNGGIAEETRWQNTHGEKFRVTPKELLE